MKENLTVRDLEQAHEMLGHAVHAMRSGSVRTQRTSRKQVDLNTGFVSVIKPTARSLESTTYL